MSEAGASDRASLHSSSVDSQSTAATLLQLLLAADIVFVLLHMLNELTPLIGNRMFSLTTDRGHAEFYQYTKWLWASFLSSKLMVQRRWPGFVAWVIFFLYLLVDDAIGVHELAGRAILRSVTLAPPAGLRAQDVAELAASASFGIVLFGSLALAYGLGTKELRKASRELLLLVAILIFFGVFVDVAHSLVRSDWKLSFILGLAEEGGEMLAGSLIVWYLFSVDSRPKGFLECALRGLWRALKRRRRPRLHGGSS